MLHPMLIIAQCVIVVISDLVAAVVFVATPYVAVTVEVRLPEPEGELQAPKRFSDTRVAVKVWGSPATAAGKDSNRPVLLAVKAHALEPAKVPNAHIEDDEAAGTDVAAVFQVVELPQLEGMLTDRSPE